MGPNLTTKGFEASDLLIFFKVTLPDQASSCFGFEGSSEEEVGGRDTLLTSTIGFSQPGIFCNLSFRRAKGVFEPGGKIGSGLERTEEVEVEFEDDEEG